MVLQVLLRLFSARHCNKNQALSPAAPAFFSSGLAPNRFGAAPKPMSGSIMSWHVHDLPVVAGVDAPDASLLPPRLKAGNLGAVGAVPVAPAAGVTVAVGGLAPKSPPPPNRPPVGAAGVVPAAPDAPALGAAVVP